MLLRNEKPIYINYPVCTKFKYLGIEISNDPSKLHKKFIFAKIREITRKMKWSNMTNFNPKSQKFACTWWIMSILYYNFISDVFLKYISIEEFKQQIIIAIKSVLQIKNGVKHKFITGFYGLKIKKTIKGMLNSIFYKRHNEEKETQQEIELKLWNYFLGGIKENVNTIFYALESRWWNKAKNICICKLCKTNLSLQHILKKHSDFLGSHYTRVIWAANIKPDYNFAKAAMQIKGKKEEVRQWILETFHIVIEIKEKAVKELGEGSEDKN